MRRKIPSPSALFVFEAAARHENFTRAAEELNVTQPAVSRALAALETFLGTSLFLRGKPGARLTENGLLLKRAVDRAFEEVEVALDEIEARRTGKAQVTLSVSTAFTTHWLMPRISRFQSVFPQVDLRFQLIPGPVTGPIGNVDIAMRYDPTNTTSSQFVMHEAYVPVCAPSYPETSKRSGGATIQLEGDRSGRGGAGEGWTGQPKDTQLRFSDYSVVVQAALVGQGIAPGWLNVVAHWLREGHLIPAADQVFCPGRSCYLQMQSDPDRPTVVAEVADWLLSELRDDLTAVDARYPDLQIGSLLTLESPAA
ncbi:LysR family transcriptional regulator [Pacificispira spongiicola]|uniref:LysR family transcriptional regulator n=1 Tax=Pacificispira spongiicola TaxID=2729598 RepID=UPI001D0C3F01|nr:LysR family transcriptional regulator [Pacificispira spongiicola]